MNKYACWLNNIQGIGRKTILTLMECGAIHSAQEIYELQETALKKLCIEKFQGKSQTLVAQRILCAHKSSPEQIADQLQQNGIHFLSVEDTGYPTRLQEIPDKPYALYFRGKLPKDDVPSVAIVGARDCSMYGQEEAAYFARKLAMRGVQIISGMARGIDGIAGMAAAKALMDGKTLEASSYAVLGCGVDICYPKQNQALYDILCDKGGVISEFPPGTEPKAGLFPQRNRIISGLADSVLVIEARERSGTLITVDQALEQGKTVYALPGRISDPLSAGCNTLLRQGAVIATDPEDILEDLYGFPAAEKAHNANAEDAIEREEQLFEQSLHGLSDLQRNIAQILHKVDAMTIEQIVKKLESSPVNATNAVSTSDVLIALVQLQVRGLAKELGAGYYVRK